MALQDIDIDLLKAVNLNRNTTLDFLFILITNSAAILAYGIPAILFGISIAKKNVILRKNSLYIITPVLIGALIALAFKYGVARQRPFELFTCIQHVAEGGSPSFPSGHTSDAFALATALSLAYPKWYIGLTFYTWAIAIGYSRIDLGVHYPTDVLGGIVIGCGSALLCHLIRQRLNKKEINA